MNTLQERKQARLEKLLDSLLVSPANKAMALEYLEADTPDEGLLEKAEYQNFRMASMVVYNEVANYLQPLWKAGKEDELIRFIRLFWAIGKSTAGFLLERRGLYLEEKHERELRIRALGKVEAAAMEAEVCAWQRHRRAAEGWLWELAASEPEVLEAAQSFTDLSWDNMKVFLAGILLCKGFRAGLLQKLTGGDRAARQAELVFANNRESLEHSVSSLTAADRDVLSAYLAKGDPAAPLPVLSVKTAADAAPDMVLGTRIASDYLTGLLGGASFQGQAQDARLRCAVRMYLALNPSAMLYKVVVSTPGEYLFAQMDNLLQDLPGGEVTLLLYLSGSPYVASEQTRRMLVDRCKFAAEQAAAAADPNQYMQLQQMLGDAVPGLSGGVQERIITMLEKYAQAGKNELRAYLTATGSMADSAARLAAVTSSQLYLYQLCQMLESYWEKHGWDDFSCRCVVVCCLPFKAYGMNVFCQKAGEFGALAQKLLEKQLPVGELLQVFGTLQDCFYNEKRKTALRNELLEVIRRPEYLEALCDAAQSSCVFGRHVALSALDDLTAAPQIGEKAKEGILAAAGDSSKQVQELLLNLLSAHVDWSPDIAALLKSKKAAERYLAVQVSARLGESMRPELETALAAEKSAKVADAIRVVLGRPAEAVEQAGEPTPEELAQRALKGGKRRRFQWLLEQPLPPVRRADGTPAEEDLRDGLLAVYCEMGRIGRSDTAAAIAKGLDSTDLAALAQEVWERWLAAGAQSKTKWVLAFAAVFGGPAMTPRLQHAINDWPQHARGAIACEAVTALTLSSDPAALLVVDSIFRKFKFRQVKAAAAAALKNAANELGITEEELADRIVPDLGFTADGSRIFDYGPRRFTVRLTPTLELSITNDAGKVVKNLPSPGKTDDPEKAAAAYDGFKAMKKQIRTTVTAQKARLEAALAALRCWDAEAWQALFVKNPIMRQFAISLIWGVYEEDRLTATFRYMEDGSFNTVDEEEYALPEGARIGLVHPVELDAETRDAWKQQLEDYEITPSIPQLERPVYALCPGREAECKLEDFGGKQLNGLSLSGKLQGLGWYRGSVQDGGGYYTFYREDPTLGLGVELSFSGCFVGDENETVTVYDAVFYKAGTVQRGSYCYDKPKDADVLLLGKVPARYYSEIVYQLTRATASSTETDPDWRTTRN